MEYVSWWHALKACGELLIALTQHGTSVPARHEATANCIRRRSECTATSLSSPELCAPCAPGGLSLLHRGWCRMMVVVPFPRRSIVSTESVASRPGRFAVATRALTRRPRPERWQLSRKRGRSRALRRCRSAPPGRAISGPLAPVIKGVSRSLADPPRRRSGRV